MVQKLLGAHLIILIAVSISALLTPQLFAQQPIGKTKNTTVDENGNWVIKSNNNYDGSASGSLFIDNYPYVQLDKDNSYWVGGYIRMDKPAAYQEVNEFFYSQVCNGYTAYVHPNDTMLNKTAQSSMFFQIFHGDLAGFHRAGSLNDPTRYRIFFHTYGAGAVWQRAESEELRYDIDMGDKIKFVMAFVRGGDAIDDPNIPAEYKSGSFIYFQILDSLNNIKKSGVPIPPNISYNSYDSIKADNTYRIYIGSDSHGNVQDQEASVKRWIEKLNVGDTNCDYQPSAMNPLLGAIYRMLIVQDVLSLTDVQDFFNDSYNYLPQSQLKLDFPGIVADQNGYSLVIPFSHWEDYTEAEGENGDIASTYFLNVPFTTDVRSGIRTSYTNLNNPLEYEILYPLNERHEKIDCNFQTIAFYLGNDIVPNVNPDFFFTASVSVTNSNHPSDTVSIFIQCSPLIETAVWNEPYLQVPIQPIDGSNAFFGKYIFEIGNSLIQHANIVGYNKVVSINNLKFKGVFDLAGVVLSNYGLPLNINEQRYLSEFFLGNNYPNPFNPSTTIKYQLPEQGLVEIKVYDVLGNEIASLVNEEKPVGSYEIDFNGNGLTSGIYFYQLRSGNYVETKKMVLIK